MYWVFFRANGPSDLDFVEDSRLHTHLQPYLPPHPPAYSLSFFTTEIRGIKSFLIGLTFEHGT